MGNVEDLAALTRCFYSGVKGRSIVLRILDALRIAHLAATHCPKVHNIEHLLHAVLYATQGIIRRYVAHFSGAK